MAVDIQAQVNDLLKFAFSPPITPGKIALQKQFASDWRQVIRTNIQLTPQQAGEIDALSDEEVGAMTKVMAASLKRGQVPKIKVVPKPTRATPAFAKVVAKAQRAPAKPGGGTNNINC
jgi:hypothetical protein